MDDFSSAVSNFLSQPGAMDQMRALAEELGLGPSDGSQETPAPSSGSASPSTPSSSSGLGISPEKLQGLLAAFSEASKPDEITGFLEALRPLLRPERQGKIDRAIRAVHLMRAAKTVTSTMDL